MNMKVEANCCRRLLPRGPLCLLLPAFVGLWVPEKAAADAFDQTHARYAAVLTNYVRNGRVDYARLQAASQGLDAYLNELAAAKPQDFAPPPPLTFARQRWLWPWRSGRGLGSAAL